MTLELMVLHHGTRMYPLADASNSHSLMAPSCFIPDVLKDQIGNAEQQFAQAQDANKD